ncbi:MAG: HEAT repeat domain-containing protein, partial [Gammaproteobacteria bacterium]|nr:HEAT repeat domain-containing protein [Gammaproteobacteria bacterium]
KDQDVNVRNSAAQALGALGSLEALPALTAALKDQSSSVRKRAVQALEALGSLEALPALTAVLKDQSGSVRKRAAQALGALGSLEALSALTVALKLKNQNGWVRDSVVQALGMLGSPKALLALTAVLKKDQDNNVRKHAARALVVLGNLEALPALTVALKDQNNDVRNSAARALGALGSMEALPALTVALKDQDNDVRNIAVQVLGALGSLEALPALIAALKDQSSSVRNRAAQALGTLGSLEALPALTAALKDQDDDVRNSAAQALGALGSLEALPALTAALENRKERTRNRRMPAPGALGSEETVRNSAVQALGALGNLAALPILTAALKDPAEDFIGMRIVAQSAAQALGRLTALPALTAALKDQNKGVRNSAVQALGALGSLEALPALTAALKDQQWNVRNSAAQALGALGSLEALPALTAALKDWNQQVRDNAAQALHTILTSEGAKDIAVLLELLQNNHSGMRRAAAAALVKQGHRAAVPFLLEILKFSARRPGEALLSAIREEQKIPSPSSLIKGKIKKTANTALAKGGEAWAVFAELLRAEHFQVKKKVFGWMKKQNRAVSLPALPHLARFTEDPDTRVRKITLEWMAGLKGLEEKADEILVANGEGELTRLLQARLEDDKERLPNRILAVKGLKALGRSGVLQTLALAQQARPALRLTAVKELAGLEAVEALHAVLEKADSFGVRLRALHELSKLKAPTRAKILLRFADEAGIDGPDKDFSLVLYDALTHSGSPDAASFLAGQLEQLEKRKSAWRKQRDAGDAQSAKNFAIKDCGAPPVRHDDEQYWRFASHEFQLSYGLVRLDPQQQAVTLLAHPLRQVRRGAAQGVSEVRDAALLRKIERARRDSKDQIFRHAAFRAIDKGLLQIQQADKREVLALLQSWQAETQNFAVRDRLEWTIGWVEYRVAKREKENNQ